MIAHRPVTGSLPAMYCPGGINRRITVVRHFRLFGQKNHGERIYSLISPSCFIIRQGIQQEDHYNAIIRFILINFITKRQIYPFSIMLRNVPSEITIWSSTVIPTTFPVSTSLFVMCISSLLGLGSPLG